MKNKDLIRADFQEAYNTALKNDDAEAMAEALLNLNSETEERIIAEARAMQGDSDELIRMQRGDRILTSEEKEFYNKFIAEVQNASTGSVVGTELTLPTTIISSVFDDIKAENEVLSVVDVQETGLSTKWIFRKGNKNLATWGAVSSAIQKEVEEQLKAFDMSAKKLSAFLFVSNDLVALGATWLDRFVRAVLAEALERGLEEAVIAGTGNGCPIGMMKDVHEGVSVSGGKYPDKTATKVKDFGATEYGKAVATLAKDEQGVVRKVSDLVLICNPVDYFTKVMPATSIKTPSGYVHDLLPLPTRIIQSEFVPEGKAVLGMGNAYKLAVSVGPTGGKLETSAEYKFLEDVETYKIKMLGDGRAKDDNCFKVLDISAVKPEVLVVENTVVNPGA